MKRFSVQQIFLDFFGFTDFLDFFSMKCDVRKGGKILFYKSLNFVGFLGVPNWSRTSHGKRNVICDPSIKKISIYKELSANLCHKYFFCGISYPICEKQWKTIITDKGKNQQDKHLHLNFLLQKTILKNP
jgi:hypothetical protein